MKKLKVLSVVGTRPEIIRLSRTIAALDKNCEHVLVHTGQNYDYELNQVFFDDLGVRKPDFFLNSAEGSTSAAHTIGNLITAVDGDGPTVFNGTTGSWLTLDTARTWELISQFNSPSSIRQAIRILFVEIRETATGLVQDSATFSLFCFIDAGGGGGA